MASKFGFNAVCIKKQFCLRTVRVQNEHAAKTWRKTPVWGGDKCATETKTNVRLPKEGTTIGASNIRFLPACGKVQELTL